MPELEDLLDQQLKFKGVRSNFIANTSGEFTGISGTSRDLSNQEDHSLLVKLRSLSDVIVTDAATARAENYGPSKWAPIEVWSLSGNFAGVDDRISHVEIENIKESLINLRKKFPSILLETGPTLTHSIGQLAEIDQLKLSIVKATNLASAKTASQQILNRLALNYLKESSITVIAGTHFFTFDR